MRAPQFNRFARAPLRLVRDIRRTKLVCQPKNTRRTIRGCTADFFESWAASDLLIRRMNAGSSGNCLSPKSGPTEAAGPPLGERAGLRRNSLCRPLCRPTLSIPLPRHSITALLLSPKSHVVSTIPGILRACLKNVKNLSPRPRARARARSGGRFLPSREKRSRSRRSTRTRHSTDFSDFSK
jgi:hypothetical protein